MVCYIMMSFEKFNYYAVIMCYVRVYVMSSLVRLCLIMPLVEQEGTAYLSRS
jgi:hypothetical protein